MSEPGGGNRPELPVVLGGRVAGPRPRTVPLRTILGSSGRSRGARRATRTAWGTAAWAAALLACATTAFAVRDTMFPKLGRTEAPSAWQAPTRPVATIPYLEREGFVAIASTPSVAAVAGSPLVTATDDTTASSVDEQDADRGAPSTATTVASAHDSAPPSATTPTVTVPSSAHPGSSVPSSSPTPSSPSSSPSTTDGVTATTTGDTLVDDGGGNQRGRGSGGSGTSVP